MVQIRVLIVLLSVFVSTSVFAQEVENENEKEDSVLDANTAFEAGKFREAAEGYAKAFLFYKDYTLKKNEMVAWFKNGNCSPALEAADLYFENSDNITESDRVDVKSIRVRCELVSAKKSLNLGNLDGCELHLNKAEQIISSDELPPVKGSDEFREIVQIRIEIEILKKNSALDPISPKEPNYLGPIVVGAGVVVGATGLALILTSVSAESDLQCTTNVAQPSCENPKPVEKVDYDSRLAEIETLNTIGWISSLVGVATIGVGTLFWLNGETEISASIDPVQGGVSASWISHF